MYDFSDILVTPAPENKVNVYNPTSYPLIGQGAQGAVFKISQSHCVKIYTSNALADLEYSSYQAAKHSFIVPLIYEKGPNYIIMEYLLGPALDNYLQTKRVLPKWVTTEILYLLKKMKQFHFSRIDFALRHVFIDKNKKFKIIDLVHAYTIEEPVPSLLFNELGQLGLLQTFLQQAQELDPLLYFEWKHFFFSNLN